MTNTVEQARAVFDAANAQYQQAVAHAERGSATPEQIADVHRLYQATLDAHAALSAAVTAEQAPAAAPAPAAVESTAAAAGSAPAVAPYARAEPVASTPAAVAEFDLSDVAPPATATAASADEAVLNRRQTLRRFAAPEPGQSEEVLRRDILGSARSEKRSEIGRERKIAGNLPDWDPLPPHEVLQAARR